MKKEVRTLKRLCLVLVVVFLASTIASANTGVLWHGVGDGGPLVGEFHGLMGRLGFRVSSGSQHNEPPGPHISDTPVRESQTIRTVFYEWALGNIHIGAGVTHANRVESGAKKTVVDGKEVMVPVTIASETTTSPIGALRVTLAEKPLFVDGYIEASSLEVSWTVRTGWSNGAFRAGVGYHSGPSGDWWSGPLVFLGSTF